MIKSLLVLMAVAASLSSGRLLPDPDEPKPEPTPPAPETLIVSYTIAPGEPGAPVESVSVARRGPRRTLTLTRKTFDDTPKTTTESFELTPGELAGVWEIVARDKLVDFRPAEREGKVFDYGERRFQTETRRTTADAPRVTDHRWVRPITNGERLAPLMKALGLLARDHGKAVRLEYFLPPPPAQ